ncbi:MAG: hypothetical protein ACYDA1_10970 [Vulcanimicrobiaceae bacterium]
MRLGTLVASLALVLSVAACSGGTTATADRAADALTKTVYANDFKGTTSQLDASTKNQVTRASVGALSDLMHRLGAYKGVSVMAQDPAKNEYTYNATFDHGTLIVAIRMDANGGVAAYHVFAPH